MQTAAVVHQWESPVSHSQVGISFRCISVPSLLIPIYTDVARARTCGSRELRELRHP
jgi:hypothetical protein